MRRCTLNVLPINHLMAHGISLLGPPRSVYFIICLFAIDNIQLPLHSHAKFIYNKHYSRTQNYCQIRQSIWNISLKCIYLFPRKENRKKGTYVRIPTFNSVILLCQSKSRLKTLIEIGSKVCKVIFTSDLLCTFSLLQVCCFKIDFQSDFFNRYSQMKKLYICRFFNFKIQCIFIFFIALFFLFFFVKVAIPEITVFNQPLLCKRVHEYSRSPLCNYTAAPYTN